MRRPSSLPTPPQEQRTPQERTPERAPETGRALLLDPIVPVEHAPAHDVTSRDLWRAARARRRALRTEIRRFTRASRRRRWIWITSIVGALLLIGGSVAAAYSPLFALEKVEVVGTVALDARTVENALASELGTPLALLDEARIKAALTAFPLIETYSLEARPPHELTVRIVERTPIGVVESPAGFTLVDAAGVALSTTATRPAGQPLLNVPAGVDSAAFRSAGLVIRSVSPEIREQLTAVSAESADSVTLSLGRVRVVWGSAERSPDKAVALDAVMTAEPDARSYDVSSPDAVVVR